MQFRFFLIIAVVLRESFANVGRTVRDSAVICFGRHQQDFEAPWYVGFSVSLVGCANVGPVTPLMKIEATVSDNSNLSAELWPTH